MGTEMPIFIEPRLIVVSWGSTGTHNTQLEIIWTFAAGHRTSGTRVVLKAPLLFLGFEFDIGLNRLNVCGLRERRTATIP